MNKTAQNRIEDIKKNGYTLDFGNVFNLAFENYKKIALYGGLVFFVFRLKYTHLYVTYHYGRIPSLLYFAFNAIVARVLVLHA